MIYLLAALSLLALGATEGRQGEDGNRKAHRA